MCCPSCRNPHRHPCLRSSSFFTLQSTSTATRQPRTSPAPLRFPPYTQLVFPNLRSDERLIAFNKQLDAFGYDLRRWRRYIEGGSGKGWGAPSRREWAEGLAILDADGGAGWDLLTRLMAYKPSDRYVVCHAYRRIMHKRERG